jgi:NAD-dependent SIR2 family protein deacetylase
MPIGSGESVNSFEMIEKSCHNSLNLFLEGILKSMSKNRLSKDEIDNICVYFASKIEIYKDYDFFLKTCSNETLTNLLRSLNYLSYYEKLHFLEILKRLMFYLGKDAFDNYVSFDKEEIYKIMSIIPNVEDLFSYADILSMITSHENINSFFNFEENIEKTVDYQSLYHVIHILLSLTNNTESSPFKGKNREPYTAISSFVNNNKSSIITFNYDTLLEKELEKMEIPYNYNINFKNDERTGEVNIYKLHGSVNWWTCKTCLRKFLYEVPNIEAYLSLVDEKSMKWKIGNSCCEECGMSPMIIPPTMFKYAKDTDLSQLWLNASEELSICNTIVIIGYSFPKEDINVINLLKNSFLRNSSLRYLIYVGPDEKPVHFIRSLLADLNIESKIEIIPFTGVKGFAEETVPIMLKYIYL